MPPARAVAEPEPVRRRWVVSGEPVTLQSARQIVDTVIDLAAVLP
jgi:hypothetical protein